ncbi:hypothetical protein M3Y99_01827600 [Aphelenchoides fujianensis]|nr:hypothetical protein M3Y99_01827600 [Aphelenchoides fujianensis]
MNTTEVLSSTAAALPSTGQEILGYAAMLGACWSDCGDGMFVQFIQCATIFAVGFVINIIRGFPPFEWIAGLSGFFYGTAGCLAIPIISSELGVGLGMLIWASVQVMVGWCVARFGLFGTHAQKVRSEPMNYGGLVLTLISGVIFVLVRTENASDSGSRGDVEKAGRSSGRTFQHLQTETIPTDFCSASNSPRSRTSRRTTRRNQDTPWITSFSYYSTTFIFGLLYFAIYAGIKRDRAFIRGALVLPSIGYGILWAAAMSLLVLSTEVTPEVISWPVIARLPPIIGVLLDIFVFRSIKGTRNFLILAAGITIGCIGVVLVSLSNWI